MEWLTFVNNFGNTYHKLDYRFGQLIIEEPSAPANFWCVYDSSEKIGIHTFSSTRNLDEVKLEALILLDTKIYMLSRELNRTIRDLEEGKIT
jgi:hypothetical protein